MLVNLKDILKDCEQHKYAVGSFNTPTLETLRAVIRAAETLGPLLSLTMPRMKKR